MDTNNKKYEFADETKVVYGRTLHRIRALVDIERFGVKAGDLGGFIEKEDNLNHYGDAWVSDNARVYGDAWVSGNARVYGDAWVSGNACVSGNAQVFGNARVYGDAWVSGNACVSGNAQVFGNAHWMCMGPMGSRNAFTTFTRDKAGTIFVSCGCFFGDVEAFLAKVEVTHGDSKHARAYRAAVALALEQIDTTPMEDENNAEN